MWNKVSLSFEKLNRLRENKKVKIDFICSVFDKESLKKVLKTKSKIYKKLHHQILQTCYC